jgi:hypothetical protein
MERDLTGYCLILEERFVGLAQEDVPRKAYQLSVRKGIANPFSQDSEKSGNMWLRNFPRTNLQFAVRIPQGLSFVRAEVSSPVAAVSQFFHIPQLGLDKIHHSPSIV